MGGFGGSNRRNDVWKSSDCGTGYLLLTLPIEPVIEAQFNFSSLDFGLENI